MTRAETPIAARVVEYPSSDGKPLAGTERHAIATVNAWQGLKHYFAERADVYVGMDMLLYFVEGDPRQSVVPDVFVVLGAPKLPPRDNWLVWHEGRMPDFVVEITSRTTRREDEGRKRQLYRRLGVTEYWQYDPTGDYLDPVLKGARLVDDAYRPIAGITETDGTPRLASALGVELHLVRGSLRLFDPRRGRDLPVFEEETVRADTAERLAATAEQRAATAEQRAVAQQQRADSEQQRAESELQRAAATQRRADAAERRVAELEARLRVASREGPAPQ